MSARRRTGGTQSPPKPVPAKQKPTSRQRQKPPSSGAPAPAADPAPPEHPAPTGPAPKSPAPEGSAAKSPPSKGPTAKTPPPTAPARKKPPRSPAPAREPVGLGRLAVVAVPVVAQAPPVLPGPSPEAAFDALYAHCADPLVRQVLVLTGNPRLADDAVARAFDQAWQRWPEVARDADPVGWLRANAYAYALAPWQRWVPAHRREPAAPAAPVPLRAALLRLPPEHRRALLLYDGLGLDLPGTAAETESSTPITAARITHARAALTTALPELSEDGRPLSVELGALLADEQDDAEPARTRKPAAVRDASERGVRRRTVAAFALTALIVTATVVTMAVAPDHSRPVPPRHAREAGQNRADTPGAPGNAPSDDPARAATDARTDVPPPVPPHVPPTAHRNPRSGLRDEHRARPRTGLRDEHRARLRPDTGKPPSP
ncbi:hypothetical protein [Streptomyces sp. NPDC008139]|uniref:hypothetical protein n=1 Tax=Streptomyces sp. NPDC008139 TaxID=3364814 RepID=UPI0036E367A9